MRQTSTHRTKTILQSWVIASLVGLVLFGVFVFRKSTNYANINYVGNVPAPTALPYSSARCYPNISSVNAINACSSDLVSYRQISYKCANGTVGNYGGPNGNCIQLVDVLRDTGKVCGTICETTSPSPSMFPSPSPSFLPSPPPTSDPSTSISCVPALFRIPVGSKITPYNLTSFISPENEVSPTDVVVKPGEVYLHGMKITNTSRQHISTAWSSFQMRANPILLDRTLDFQKQYSWAEGCVIDSSDTIACPAEHFSLAPGQSQVLKQPLFVTAIDKVPLEEPTTSGYHIVYKSASSDHVVKDCGTEKMTNYRPTTSPTPTPSEYWTCVYRCLVKSRHSIAACREACKR